MLNRIISAKLQYLKLFNSVAKLNYQYFIKILETICVQMNENILEYFLPNVFTIHIFDIFIKMIWH